MRFGRAESLACSVDYPEESLTGLQSKMLIRNADPGTTSLDGTSNSQHCARESELLGGSDLRTTYLLVEHLVFL